MAERPGLHCEENMIVAKRNETSRETMTLNNQAPELRAAKRRLNSFENLWHTSGRIERNYARNGWCASLRRACSPR